MEMDNMFGGPQLGGGMGQFPLEQWFYEMPVCTRWWTTATVAISILVQCHVITPFQMFYSFRAVFVKNQVCPSFPPLLAFQEAAGESSRNGKWEISAGRCFEGATAKG